MLNFFFCFFLLFFVLSSNINLIYTTKRFYLLNLYKKYIFYYYNIIVGFIYNLKFIKNYFNSFNILIFNFFFNKGLYYFTLVFKTISTNFLYFLENKIYNFYFFIKFLWLLISYDYYFNYFILNSFKDYFLFEILSKNIYFNYSTNCEFFFLKNLYCIKIL